MKKLTLCSLGIIALIWGTVELSKAEQNVTMELVEIPGIVCPVAVPSEMADECYLWLKWRHFIKTGQAVTGSDG